MEMEKIVQLLSYLKVMQERSKGVGEPGYLHFRVLSDYIRSGVEKGQVTWVQLGLSGEADLCQLELECLEYAEEAGLKFEVWLRPALEAKLKAAQGKRLSSAEAENIIELYPNETIRVAAA